MSKQLTKTSAGLPNTCANCGEFPGDSWYAENDEQARAGQGLCKDCAFPAKEEKPSAEEQTGEPVELDSLTVDELQEIAADLDIDGRSSMKKAELIEAIEAAR